MAPKESNHNRNLSDNSKREKSKPIQIDRISNRSKVYIKDGYEIYVKGVYIVDGRKKRKVKVKKDY